MFAIVTIVALLASPIILWLDPWVWGFPTIYFLVSANVAVVVYLYFTIFSYVFLLFSVVSSHSSTRSHAAFANRWVTLHRFVSPFFVSLLQLMQAMTPQFLPNKVPVLIGCVRCRGYCCCSLIQVLGYFKMWAMISGILGLKKSKSWKVTLKFAANDSGSWLRSYHKPYTLELALFAYYGLMLGFSIWYENWGLVAYNGVMAFSFLIVSFGDYFL